MTIRVSKALPLIALFFCLGARAFAAVSIDVAPRSEQNFSTHWLYTPKDIAGGEGIGLDDKGFEHVSVPHANVLIPGEVFDSDLPRFVSWYRKHFRPDASWKGKLVMANFQGVMKLADVYLNGKYLATHKGGYTSFDVDLTPALRFGADNVIAVRVDSRIHTDFPPEYKSKFGGYYNFGGIQRDVQLRVTDRLHIERVYYVTNRIQPDAAVHATVTVRNDRPAGVQASVRVHILDDTGKEVASAGSSVSLNAGETQDVGVDVAPIADPKLWDTDHPNRYIAVAEVADGSGAADREATWIGLRLIEWGEIDWDKKDGVLRINGKPLKIRGMNRHQTQAFLGGAVPNRLQRRDAQILKYGLGLNMVRSSHYPPDPEFLDECDRIGLLVMDELPSWGQVVQDAAWQQSAVEMVREMILRDRNHPSIIIWGVHVNEASPKETDDRELYAKTYGLVRELDPTRRPGGARSSGAWSGKIVPEEVLTMNDYANDHFPQPVTTQPWLITEYSLAPDQLPLWSDEGSLLNHALKWAEGLNAIYAHPEIAGGVGWAAFDYYSPEFNTPWGVTAYHCIEDNYRLPKGFSPYVFESQKDPDLYGPVVHLLSYWFRPFYEPWGGTTDLWVASNAEEVEVRLNGKSIGRQRPTEYTSLPHPLFKFQLSDAQAGTIEAIAYRKGEIVAREQLHTPQEPQALQVMADDSEIVGDGADLVRVAVYAVDANGTVAVYDDRRIDIEVKNGSLVGMSPVHLESGRIAFFVRAKEGSLQPIVVHVSAESDDLHKPIKSAEQRITVVAPVDGVLPFGPFDTERNEALKFVPPKR